jgi:peptidoglycan/LPS O-acetylase OafA/YrhL
LHRDHYGDVVGSTIALHGTVALISFIVFGALLPLVYAFSHRQTDDRDQKFILCCGATIVVVSLLSLGKARVSNRRYLRTLGAYLLVLVLSSIVGYLTGDHVAELLDNWGI